MNIRTVIVFGITAVLCAGVPQCPPGQHWDEKQQRCVPDGT